MQPSRNSADGLKASDVDPRIVFHQGIPSGGAKFAYDTIQQILALSTKYVDVPLLPSFESLINYIVLFC